MGFKTLRDMWDLHRYNAEKKEQEQKDKKEAKRKKQEEQENKRKERQNIEKTVNNIIIFPGSLSEFEKFIGYECSVIDISLKTDLGAERMYLFYGYCNGFKGRYDGEILKKLYDEKIVALIRTPCFHGETYGIPVKKAEKPKSSKKSKNSSKACL